MPNLIRHQMREFATVSYSTSRHRLCRIPAYVNVGPLPRPEILKLPFRILVLDDDEHTLAGIVELLRDAEYVVTAAATYDAAKRLLRPAPTTC